MYKVQLRRCTRIPIQPASTDVYFMWFYDRPTNEMLTDICRHKTSLFYVWEWNPFIITVYDLA
jgi:hypothetical protein